MVRFERQKTPAAYATIGASLLAVLGLDLLTPLGVAVWVFYLVPVGVSLYTWRPRIPLLVAAACTLFIAVGLIISHGLIEPSAALPRLNRGLVTVAIWVLAIVTRRFILAKLQLREQDWVRSGQRDLAVRMQGEQNLPELGDTLLRFLCEYVQAPVGAFYAAKRDGSLRRVAAYALGTDAGAPEIVARGEGLLGQAVKDGRLLCLSDLPDGYLQLSSSLGRTRAAHVVAVPTQADGEVNGAIELGFLHPVGRSDLHLLETVSESVAVALRSSQYRARQAELLEETQRQAEELQAQQEELRVANEELESQSNVLRDSQARLESQQDELQQTNAQLEEQAQALERQRDDLSRAHAEILERSEELARSNRYKSEFLANMSHELRTPLNSALILAKLLADNKDGNLTPEQVKYAATVYASGNDLLALINDILDLSRIESGRVEVQLEPVEPARVLEALRRGFQPVADERKLRFEIAVDPATPASVVTDPMRLQQILRNLLSNALKFTEAGEVTLHVAPAPGGRVGFAVRDTGIGIPAGQQEVIFEAFRQADGTTQRRYGGTGLGLTISRELAHHLGGEITVESAPGRGSTFTLFLHVQAALPAAPPPELPAPLPAVLPGDGLHLPAGDRAGPAAAPPGPPAVEDDREALVAGQRTILVVEDDLPFARIVRDLAREQRFQCLVATTASEGLALAERYDPKAIVLDLHLPDGSGLSVLETLKRHPTTRHIPVHVLSVSDHTQQALELGAVGYAVKPVRREQLVSTFRKLEEKLEQKVRRVLVVEDAEAQRESIVALLSAENVEIVSVATAREALLRLEGNTFDAMVLDLKLPDMSGYELLDRMASGEAFSFPPVVVYTGGALSRDDEQRLRKYASSVIIKGVRSPERLLDEVTLFLHQVERELPPQQRRLLEEVRGRDAALEGKAILLVEDDVRNVFAVSSVLEPRGAKLRIARNGREALAALDRARTDPAAGVDLVLMDIMMPEMDGLAAIREIRRRAEWKKLPVIALTAKAMPDDRARCLQAGANDYIAKPLDVQKLVSLVKVWMPK